MSRQRTRIATGTLAAIVLAGILGVGTAHATDFSFTGSFQQDDEVQLFNFTVGGSSSVILRTWSYAGGTNAAGNVIERGGFDPILALFDGTGFLIDTNDDGGCGPVVPDALTGMCWDTYFEQALTPGSYTVAIMEYNNFANGPYLSDGFARTGQGNFTATFGWCADDQAPNATGFCDVSGVLGGARSNAWAFDILGVESASTPPPVNSVPEPSPLGLLGLGALLCGLFAWRRRRVAE